MPEKKYEIQCTKCGHIIRRAKMSQAVKFPERYIHKNCGGRFKRIK